MRSLPPRKLRISPVVEPLEDRRLPSRLGMSAAWDGPARAMSDPVELAPPIRGPIQASADGARPTGRDAPPMAPGSEPFAPARDDHAPPASPSTGSQADPAPAQPAREAVPASSPVDAPSTGSESPIPATAAPVVEAAGPTAVAGRSVVPREPDLGPPAGPSGVAAATEPPPHVAAAVASPAIRSTVAAVQPSHGEVEASTHADAPDHPEAESSSIAVAGTLAVESSFAAGNPARGSATSGPSNGPGSIASQARPAHDPGFAKAPGDGRSPGEPPPSTSWEPETAEARAAIEGGEANSAEGAIEPPDPRLAEMIMNLAPLARSSLEEIVDRFIGPLDGLPPSMMSELYGPMGLLAASLTLAATVLAVEISSRVGRSREEEGEDRLVEFPGLPGLRGRTGG